jgi:transcriptional regulatory protein LevR
LGSLIYGLTAYTQDEVSGHYRNNPEIVEQFDEARKVITAIAKNLGEEIDEVLALTMGLIELIPREQLEKWAQSKNSSEITRKERAQYFLAKSLGNREHKNPKPSV